MPHTAARYSRESLELTASERDRPGNEKQVHTKNVETKGVNSFAAADSEIADRDVATRIADPL